MLLGGRCVDCGETEDLELDHIDPDTKRFQPFGSGYAKPWEVWIEEVFRCELRCASCHLVRTVREGHHVPPGRERAAAQIAAQLSS